MWVGECTAYDPVSGKHCLESEHSDLEPTLEEGHLLPVAGGPAFPGVDDPEGVSDAVVTADGAGEDWHRPGHQTHWTEMTMMDFWIVAGKEEVSGLCFCRICA